MLISLGIVQSKTADDHPLGELIISAPDGPSSHIDMKFLSTPRASTEGQLDLKLLPDAYVTSSESANGYWVLGDTLKVRVLEEWFNQVYKPTHVTGCVRRRKMA